MVFNATRGNWPPGKKVSIDRGQTTHTQKKASPEAQEDTSFISHKRLALQLLKKKRNGAEGPKLASGGVNSFVFYFAFPRWKF
jgi:hypothetical protein